MGTGMTSSHVNGTLLSAMFGDGFHLRASGIIGSFVGAVIVTYV